MKKKLWSILMLMACTAMMFVGCGGGKTQDEPEATTLVDTLANDAGLKKQGFTASDCNVCSTSDKHLIDVDSALILIAAFHNRILKGSSINNAGGYFTEFRNPTSPLKKNIINNYPTFKIHWALENINTDTVPLKRLFITIQESPRNCLTNGQYEGTAGIESGNLMSTYISNDIPLFTSRDSTLTTTKVLFELMKNRRSITPPYYREVQNNAAAQFLDTFRKDKDVGSLYSCDDIVFNRALSLDQVSGAAIGKKSFFYFFGYDSTQVYHKLRLILAGFDAKNKIIFYDANGISLLRENSRPRP